ncbi:hypothetical protein [Porphyromonas cangingivalis]|uniref:hypothetical protein n=1 Tax=Porphyromonas cangingivalis TaxID=36874 RepID=UPI002432C536|nr:hypothetical protein [Porphyromonas cangingivalis]
MDPKHRTEEERTDECFGLMDGATGNPPTPAYSSLKNQKDWIATVLNPEKKAVCFVPIDSNILHHNDLPGVGRCDGILLIEAEKRIIFVELKEVRRDWIQTARNQLKDTIYLFKKHHPDFSASFLIAAFGCNRKRKKPYGASNRSVNTTKKKFLEETGVRLYLQAEINLQTCLSSQEI